MTSRNSYEYHVVIDEDSEESVLCLVEWEFTPYTPGRMYMRNGDPGYPPEGAEANILSIRPYNPDGSLGEDCLPQISERKLEKLETQIIEDEEDGFYTPEVEDFI